MKTILCLIVIINCVFGTPAKFPRRYFPEEEDPDYRRYIFVQNAEGKIEYVDLRNATVTTRAELTDVTYYLYTQANVDDPYIITNGDILQLEGTTFDPSRETVFISHGWNNDFSSNVNVYIKNAILSVIDMNVFVVDWAGPANSNYLTAMLSVVDIGTFEGAFINDIMLNYGMIGDNFMLIGHSLGAHVAGNAGHTMIDQARHIVALDPASPLFTLGDTSNRVDPSDAKFVQIIHTNGGLLGFASAIGSADYFPNGGMWQDGCGFDITGTCAHGRSYEYYAESVTRGVVFWATICGSYDDYQAGACSDMYSGPMGMLDLDYFAVGDFYLTTNPESPYGQG